MKAEAEKVVPLGDFASVPTLVGSYNSNLKFVSQIFDVKVIARDNIRIIGSDEENVEKAYTALDRLKQHIEKHKTCSQKVLENIVSEIQGEKATRAKVARIDDFPVSPRSPKQSDYMFAIREFDVVFGVGPAGTGKTYLAVAIAVEALKKGRVNKIVLVRPAVEDGEKLGFLPGDYQAKIDPYLQPLYDALQNLLGSDRLKKYLEREIIEIAPLAYMRGRTLESAFIILDEAQNTTVMQMKMFLTRLGVNSKMVVTGDRTQIDLPASQESGLLHAERYLKEVKGLRFFYLTSQDIVRHPLVQSIVEAYDNDSK